MTTLAASRATAGARYVAAVIEFRAAWVDLAAHDRIAGVPGFGDPPAIVPLRHTEFAPNVSGAMTDGVVDAMQTLAATLTAVPARPFG